MNRITKGKVALLLLVLATTVFAPAVMAQQLYDRQVLGRLGLSETEIEQVIRTVRESAAAGTRLNAELNIKKAELARILLDESPSKRQIERNLRESAEIEVQLRILEIERELAVRAIVGTDRWTAILRELRSHARETVVGPQQSLLERFQALHRDFHERQAEIAERLRTEDRTEAADAVMDQLREIEAHYRELVELLRNR